MRAALFGMKLDMEPGKVLDWLFLLSFPMAAKIKEEWQDLQEWWCGPANSSEEIDNTFAAAAKWLG